MELVLEYDSNLNKANYYQRNADSAMKRISKYVRLIEKSYFEAVSYLQNAISHLEAAQKEIEKQSEEQQIYDFRISQLHRELELLHPYRFLNTCSFDKPSSNLIRKRSAPIRTSPTSPLNLDSSDWTIFQPSDLVDSATGNAKKYPKNSDQQLEETAVRLLELSKLVDDLSKRLLDSEKMVAEERSRRLTAEAEILACQLDTELSATNSAYNSTSRHFSLTHSPLSDSGAEHSFALSDVSLTLERERSSFCPDPPSSVQTLASTPS